MSELPLDCSVDVPVSAPQGRGRSDNQPGHPETGDKYTVRSGRAYELGSDAVWQSPADRRRAEKLREGLKDMQVVPLRQRRPLYVYVKRVLGVIFSVLTCVLFCWLFLIVALAIKIEDPKGPVIFKQERIGMNGKPFHMYKFRSMCVDAEKKLADLKDLNEKGGPVFKIADDPRVTRVGRFIRKMSLDELPQFFNVIKGDMAICGPRPALPEEVAEYTDYQRQRLIIKPGITCYWQTRQNRDSISFEEWVDLDLLYIGKCGLWADIKIVIQTIGCVLSAQGC